MRLQALSFSEIEFLLSEEQNRDAILIALFEQSTPKEGESGFSCEAD